jgi:hypothetical protein
MQGLKRLLMSVILVDLGNDEHDIMVSNAGWRDTVEVLRPLEVLDCERLQRLQTAWLGEQFTPAEAQGIGTALVNGPLLAVYWSDNIYPPSGYFRDALAGKMRDYDRETCWPSWLRAFAGFCLTCKGFIVY